MLRECAHRPGEFCLCWGPVLRPHCESLQPEHSRYPSSIGLSYVGFVQERFIVSLLIDHSSSQQVADIVRCAADNEYPVQARSGGHSYGNYGGIPKLYYIILPTEGFELDTNMLYVTGLGGTDGAVAIDLKHLKHFSMDNTTWQATIGAGSLLSDVTQRLSHAGGRAMSHGICPQVGSGGHFTIGGLGPTSRQFGTSIDHVVEVEVVLANSSIVRASDTENQDLFWAIKGAASGYGIVTEFKVRTEPEPGTAVQYTYSMEIGNPKKQAALSRAGRPSCQIQR